MTAPSAQSGTHSRTKGLAGEREVAAIWQAAGFAVRNLEGQGDHLVIVPPLRVLPDDGGHLHLRPPIHSEVKRAERLKLPEWLRQARDEAPQGTIPVVCFRQNRGEWYSCLPLSSLVELAS